MTTIQVKEERHDEAEIIELANKMREQHRTAAAKAVLQQQQQARIGQLPNITGNIVAGNQSNIMNYLNRQTNPQQTAQLQQKVVQNGNKSSNPTETINLDSSIDDSNKLPCDEESAKGHFGWETLANKLYIPYIIRQHEKYCAVRILETKLLSKYLNYLHADLFNCTYVRSYYITDAESRLLNEINVKHCDSQYGKEPFTTKDLVVKITEAVKFYQFLEICYKKLLTNCSTPNDKCGFIRINKESVVPYTIRDGQKMVPLFYFEGETDNLKLKADSLSGWDLSYLKFCCKVQGIRNELFSSDTVAVISLEDIKSYFPQGTIFEDYWPNKVVDTQLLVGAKSSNSVVHWTRQPAHPPPKQILNQITKQQTVLHQQQLQKQHIQQQQQQRNMTATATNNMQSSLYRAAEIQQQYLRMQQQQQASGPTSQAGLTAAVQALANGWSNQFTQSQIEQMLRLQNKNQQAVAMRQYNQSQVTNYIQNQLYTYQGLGMDSNLLANNTRTSNQQAPPPLVRSNQTSQNHMSNCVSGSSILRSNSLTDGSMTSPSSTSSRSTPSYPVNNNSGNNNANNGQNIVTITRCPPQSQLNQDSVNSYLNKIPQSTTIIPSNNPNQFYKDLSLPSSLSIYPKNMNSSVRSNAAIPASPTRASPQSYQAKHPAISPASPLNNILPGVLQQQIEQIFNKQNINLNAVDSEILKETLLSTLSSRSAHRYPLPESPNANPNQQQTNYRNKSVITSRASMDVIDLSPSSTPRSAIQAVAAASAAAQQQAAKRNINGQYMNGQSTRSVLQNSSSSSGSSSSTTTRSMHQQQQQQQHYGDLNGHYIPYKVQRIQIENTTVNCVNMNSFSHNLQNELLMPISELRDAFYPSLNLDVCRRVMVALEINMYKGNKGQYQAYLSVNKQVPESVPLVKVVDIIQYMPQISYMMRASNSQESGQPANKRVCIS